MAGKPFQAHPCREHVWAGPDMGAILTIKGLVRGRFFWLLFSPREKWLAHLLNIYYEVEKDLVCETLVK